MHHVTRSRKMDRKTKPAEEMDAKKNSIFNSICCVIIVSSVIIIHASIISRFPRLFTFYSFNPCTRYTKNQLLSLISSNICLSLQTLLVVKRASNLRVMRPIEFVIIISSRVSSRPVAAVCNHSFKSPCNHIIKCEQLKLMQNLHSYKEKSIATICK